MTCSRGPAVAQRRIMSMFDANAPSEMEAGYDEEKLAHQKEDHGDKHLRQQPCPAPKPPLPLGPEQQQEVLPQHS
jgi:hypothetical protein